MEGELRWTKVATSGAGVVGVSWGIALAAPSVGAATYAIVSVVVAWTGAVVVYLRESWARDHKREFEDQLAAFYIGINQSYKLWRLLNIPHTVSGKLPEAPANADVLARRAGWILSADRVAGRDQEMMWHYVERVYPMVRTESLVKDNYEAFHAARRSMSHYLEDVCRKARQWNPLWHWVVPRLRRPERAATLRIIMALDVALVRQQTDGDKADLVGHPLARLPYLLEEGTWRDRLREWRAHNPPSLWWPRLRLRAAHFARTEAGELSLPAVGSLTVMVLVWLTLRALVGP